MSPDIKHTITTRYGYVYNLLDLTVSGADIYIAANSLEEVTIRAANNDKHFKPFIKEVKKLIRKAKSEEEMLEIMTEYFELISEHYSKYPPPRVVYSLPQIWQMLIDDYDSAPDTLVYDDGTFTREHYKFGIGYRGTTTPDDGLTPLVLDEEDYAEYLEDIKYDNM